MICRRQWVRLSLHYLEPFAPPSRLVVIGDSPVARNLLVLGPLLGFDTVGHPDPGTPDLSAPAEPDTWLAIASMGDADELVAEAALRSGVSYVALVASRRRAASVLDCNNRRRRLGAISCQFEIASAGWILGNHLPKSLWVSPAEIVAEATRHARQDQRSLIPIQPAASSRHRPVCGSMKCCREDHRRRRPTLTQSDHPLLRARLQT